MKLLSHNFLGRPKIRSREAHNRSQWKVVSCPKQACCAGRNQWPQCTAPQPRMSDLECSSYHPLFVDATLLHHQPLDVLLRLKILWRVTVCLAKKKKTESMSEREGKGKAETWAHKPDVEDKGRLCFTSFIPSTNKRLITGLSLNRNICFVCSTANFFPRVTQLPLFLKNSSGDALIKHLSLDETCIITLSFCPRYTFWHFRSTNKGILT